MAGLAGFVVPLSVAPRLTLTVWPAPMLLITFPRLSVMLTDAVQVWLFPKPLA